MTNRRTFLKDISLLTLGGIASQKVMVSDPTRSTPIMDAVSSAVAEKKMGLQTYSFGQELLRGTPNRLDRLAKVGYTDLEVFGYREDIGKFSGYNPRNMTSIASKDYKRMVDDAGLRISSPRLTPSLREYTKKNMSRLDELWKKVTDVHAELGISCMVQPSLLRIGNEDDIRVVSEISSRAGEITKKVGVLQSYHNHSNEFRRVLKAGEKPEQNPNPWAPPKDVYTEELLLKSTDPDKVMFELNVYWAAMGQQDPVGWMENYPDRFKLLHIRNRWIIGDPGIMNFPSIFKKTYEIGILGYYVELEGGGGDRIQFEGVEKSVTYLQTVPFVK